MSSGMGAYQLHPQAQERLADFERRHVAYATPVHEPGVCAACDAWRLMFAKLVSR